MSMSDVPVCENFREILVEFVTAYLLDKPGTESSQIVDYAVRFFTALQARQNQTSNSLTAVAVGSDDSEEEEVRPAANLMKSRRKSVCAELYDPEKADDTERIVHSKTDEQRQRLWNSVKDILLFRSLDREQMNEIIDAMFEIEIRANDIIIKEGDPNGDNFYVIESGIYNVYLGEDKMHVNTYNNSGSFGELALLYNTPRAATVKAVSSGKLWALDRQTFRRILLNSAFKKRKMYESLIDGVPMLKALENYERMNLADALIPQSFADGAQIIKQGDTADGMYFIENGTVLIKMVQDGQEVEISQLGKGDYFGELALVTQNPRAASAYAIGAVKLAFLDVKAFERLLGPCMDIMKRNIDDYETQLANIFGNKNDIASYIR